MRRRGPAAALAAVLGLLWLQAAEAASREDVERCLAANAPRQSLALELELRSRHRGGAEFGHRGRLQWRRADDGSSQSLICMTHPPGVRGLAYLIHQREAGAEVWGYLPEEERVLRIQAQGAARRARIGKSAIRYDDFEYLPVNVRNAVPTAPEEGELDGRPVWRVRLAPPAGEDSAYARIEADVDRESCVPLRTLFYGPGGELVKRVRADASSLASEDGLRLARSLLIEDLPHEVETLLRVERIEVDPPLPAALFTTRELARGRCR